MRLSLLQGYYNYFAEQILADRASYNMSYLKDDYLMPDVPTLHNNARALLETTQPFFELKMEQIAENKTAYLRKLLPLLEVRKAIWDDLKNTGYGFVEHKFVKEANLAQKLLETYDIGSNPIAAAIIVPCHLNAIAQASNTVKAIKTMIIPCLSLLYMGLYRL